MTIDDKINAAHIALKAFKEADRMIASLACLASDDEEAKAFKALVLSRLASICLDCSDELLGVSTASKEQELKNYLIDYPIQYGSNVMLLTGTVRYAWVGIKGKKHYKAFDVARWKWEDEKLNACDFQGPTEIDLAVIANLGTLELNHQQDKYYA
jgi:hypothetical protein